MWEPYVVTLTTILLHLIAGSAASAASARDTMFLCYDACETDFNVCISQNRETSKKTVSLWLSCVDTKTQCTKSCRTDCWLRCKLTWKSCFRLQGMAAVQMCMKAKQRTCAMDCAVKKRRLTPRVLFIATARMTRLIIWHEMLMFECLFSKSSISCCLRALVHDLRQLKWKDFKRLAHRITNATMS